MITTSPPSPATLKIAPVNRPATIVPFVTAVPTLDEGAFVQRDRSAEVQIGDDRTGDAEGIDDKGKAALQREAGAGQQVDGFVRCQQCGCCGDGIGGAAAASVPPLEISCSAVVRSASVPTVKVVCTITQLLLLALSGRLLPLLYRRYMNGSLRHLFFIVPRDRTPNAGRMVRPGFGKIRRTPERSAGSIDHRIDHIGFSPHRPPPTGATGWTIAVEPTVMLPYRSSGSTSSTFSGSIWAIVMIEVCS